MVDFSSLLKKPISDIKKPPLLPTGDYPSRISEYKLGETSKNKIPQVTYTIKPTSWPDTVDPSDQEGIDLAKRSLRRNFMLSDDALWRLTEFAGSIGVTGDTLEELIAGCVGCDVNAEILQKMNESSGELFNEVGKLGALD